MRCRICGKQIQNGTLCDECYEEYRKNKESDNDKTIVMRINRKFLPKHQLLVNWEWILFSIFILICSFSVRNFLTVVLSFFIVMSILAIMLFFTKKIAIGTKCIFYETKVIYKFDFLFIHKVKVLKYSEIKDITYNQGKLQKKFGLGNLNIISNKSGILFRGIMVQDVANIKDVFKKLTELVGNKIF